MCKVFMMAGIKKEKTGEVAKLVKAVTSKMAAIPDNDGFGYAAITSDGNVYGQKWLNVDQAWQLHKNPEPPTPSKADLWLKDNFSDILEGLDTKTATQEIYSAFGSRTQDNISDTVAIILHSRNATQGEKNIKNVHPFVHFAENRDPIALIHNGEIKNHTILTKKYSTCDSETIMWEYLNNNMNYEPENMDKLADTLKGLYAVGVLSSYYDNEANVTVPYLDIFKSGKDLVCGYIEELECTFFTTKEEVIKEALKEVEMTLASDKTYKVKDGALVRISAVTGKTLGLVDFTTSVTYWHPGNNNNFGTGNNDYSRSRSITPFNGHGSKETENEKMKKEFEKDNPSLFEGEYFDVGEMSSEDKAALEVIEKRSGVSSRALELVKMAVGHTSH